MLQVMYFRVIIAHLNFLTTLSVSVLSRLDWRLDPGELRVAPTSATKVREPAPHVPKSTKTAATVRKLCKKGCAYSKTTCKQMMSVACLVECMHDANELSSQCAHRTLSTIWTAQLLIVVDAYQLWQTKAAIFFCVLIFQNQIRFCIVTAV